MCPRGFLQQQKVIWKRFLAIFIVIVFYFPLCIDFCSTWMWFWSAWCLENRVPVEANSYFWKICVLSYSFVFHHKLDPKALRLDAKNAWNAITNTNNVGIGWNGCTSCLGTWKTLPKNTFWGGLRCPRGFLQQQKVIWKRFLAIFTVIVFYVPLCIDFFSTWMWFWSAWCLENCVPVEAKPIFLENLRFVI